MTSPDALVGSSVLRREDDRFIRGAGKFVADLLPAHALYGLVVRSRHASGKIVHIDPQAAREAPGVHLVLTGADLAGTSLEYVPVDLPPPGMDFETWQARPQRTLALDEVGYVGDPVAFVVADDLAAAADAAEALVVDIEDAKPVVAMADAPFDFSYAEGDQQAVRQALAAAAASVEATLEVHRVDALPLEPRGCIAEFADDRFTLHVSTQRVQIIQRALADRVFRVPREAMRVVAPDTGGGFGQKNGLYPEYVLCLEAARRLGRTVQWIAERSEALSSGCHARDNLFCISAAIDADGRISAVAATRRMNLGAYASSRSMVPVQNGLTHLTGVYAIPQAHVRVEGVFTNTAPTCSYRGAGRPENVYACERLIDMVARRTGRDPIALRRALLLQPSALPWTSPLGTRFDGQDFPVLLDEALSALDHAGFAERRRRAQAGGLLRGFGVALFAEDLHGSHEPFPARLSLEEGRLVLTVGTGSAGHGHETTFLQIVADRLRLPMDRLDFRQSDTAHMAEGAGTAASWSTTLAGSSVRLAADAALDTARDIAGELLEAPAVDVLFDAGLFRVAGTDRVLGWDEVFSAAPRFAAAGTFSGTGQNVPAACHACEVEIDPDTGACRVVGHAIAQDSGAIVNPLIVEGQLHGGAVQGLGQNLMEKIVYDPQSGQLLSGALTDYALPRAADAPKIMTRLLGIPASDNPLGVKGVGEAAATGAPAALANAVLDALWELGVEHLDPPFTAEKIWQAIRARA